MNNTVLNEALAKVRKAKINADTSANLNLLNAMENKQFKTLYSSLKELQIAERKAAFAKKTTVQFTKEIKEKEKEIVTLLAKLNISHITPIYSCSLCSDTGADKQGNICKCALAIYSSIVAKTSGSATPHNLTFETAKTDAFKTDVQKQYMQKLYHSLNKYASEFPNNSKKTLTLLGNTGSGKSYSAALLSNTVANRGYNTFFTTATNLVINMQKYHSPIEKDKHLIIEPFLNADMLVIDDLGTEPMFNNITIEYLYLIINERMIKDKHIVITTNLEKEQIRDKYGDRIFSRLFGGSLGLAIDIRNKSLR